MTFELPNLDYEYNALEPHIDARTMEIHHSKHHAGYTKNFNTALEGTDIKNKTAEQIVADLNSLPENVRTAVCNNGGGYVNHKLFWTILSPKGGGFPFGELQKQCILSGEILISLRKSSIQQLKLDLAVAGHG